MDTKKLRQKILDLAIHGKLVPQDPNDEPALVLLERIRAEKERLIKGGKIKRSRKTTKTSDATYDEQEVPFEVPSGWVWCKLDDIVLFQGGYAYKSNTYVSSSEWQVVRIGNVKNDNLILDTQPVFVKDIIAKETEKYLLEKDDILFTMTGTKGKRDYFYSVKVPSTQKKLLLNQRVGCLKRISLEIDIDFLCFALKGEYVLDAIFSTETGNVSQGNIGSESTLNLYIALPPFAEQQRIATEIKRWFKLIDIIEQGKADLQSTIKQAKNKILDLAIHGKLVPQDPNDEPASELLKRINPKAEITCDNGHYPKLPKGWCLCKLKNISLIITGSTPSKSNSAYYGGKVPFYKPADLDAGRFVDSSAEYLSEAGKAISRVVPIGSTAVCCIGSIGKVGYLIKEGTTNQQINCVIPSEAVDSVFLYYLCISPLFYQELITLSSAVTISIINKSKMENIIVPLPPIEEQKRIVSKIEVLFGFINTIEENL